MINKTPEIAIIEPNTLTALGLQTILEELIPDAIIRVFPNFASLIDDTPDMYAHYFVSIHIYFEHTSFFLERFPKAIVLSTNEHPLLKNNIPNLNISLPREQLILSLMQLHTHGHNSSQHPHSSASPAEEHELSPREIEVLILLTKGFINKEIAEKLNIGQTTVITHRKNITAKLGIKSIAGLAIYAVMHGYIEADRI